MGLQAGLPEFVRDFKKRSNVECEPDSVVLMDVASRFYTDVSKNYYECDQAHTKSYIRRLYNYLMTLILDWCKHSPRLVVFILDRGNPLNKNRKKEFLVEPSQIIPGISESEWWDEQVENLFLGECRVRASVTNVKMETQATVRVFKSNMEFNDFNILLNSGQFKQALYRNFCKHFYDILCCYSFTTTSAILLMHTHSSLYYAANGVCQQTEAPDWARNPYFEADFLIGGLLHVDDIATASNVYIDSVDSDCFVSALINTSDARIVWARYTRSTSEGYHYRYYDLRKVYDEFDYTRMLYACLLAIFTGTDYVVKPVGLGPKKTKRLWEHAFGNEPLRFPVSVYEIDKREILVIEYQTLREMLKYIDFKPREEKELSDWCKTLNFTLNYHYSAGGFISNRVMIDLEK